MDAVNVPQRFGRLGRLHRGMVPALCVAFTVVLLTVGWFVFFHLGRTHEPPLHYSSPAINHEMDGRASRTLAQIGVLTIAVRPDPTLKNAYFITVNVRGKDTRYRGLSPGVMPVAVEIHKGGFPLFTFPVVTPQMLKLGDAYFLRGARFALRKGLEIARTVIAYNGVVIP